jgi:L-ascorbate metabolism protein UlaG (beta-lactamase superfamily)
MWRSPSPEKGAYDMPSVKFLGHTCFTVAEGADTIIFDPFLEGNPQAVCGPDDVDVTAVLPTHGHSDHIGDTVPIAKRCDALVIAPYELAVYCERQGCKVHPLHIGGGADFPFGRVKLTIAMHGSGIMEEEIPIYTGPACGFLLTMGGKTLYYAGDTGLFGDMKLLGDLNTIDLAFLPIGDNFTMGIDDAVEAVKLLNPAAVVPMHYNTFDPIMAEPEDFAAKVSAETSAKCIIMSPGETIEV